MIRFQHPRLLIASSLALGFALLFACTTGPSDQTVQQISDDPAKPAQRVAQQRTVLPPGQPAASQETFATPDDAVKALVMACESKDHADMDKIFGPARKDFVTGDPVEDQNDFNAFADAAAEHAVFEEPNDHLAILRIGKEEWAYPIPIAKTNDGKWYFDTVAGETEILARRIGANELQAISLCRSYVDAQREYASTDRDGSEVLKYAQRLASSPAKYDGLYWPADTKTDGPGASPFGPLVADAATDGYPPISGSHKAPVAYYGYFFHVLKSQGSNARGGAYDYVINGNMIAGFALVAYPAEYGKSGIMTFIVSHQGKIHQKDLGPGTTTLAAKMTRYDPDKSWALVKD